MHRPISVNSCSLDSFEGLHQAIQGSHVEGDATRPRKVSGLA